MSFWGHIAELRLRLIRSVAWVALAGLAAWAFLPQLFEVLRHPLTLADPQLQLNNFSVLEQFHLYVRVVVYAAITAASPLILWEVWAFIAPGLTPRERGMVRPVLPFVLLLFAGGVVFVYYMLLPISLKVLLGMVPPGVANVQSQTQYMNFVLGLCLAGGLLFELPVVLALAGWIGLVDSRWLWKHSAHAFIVLMILAAVITPTGDAFTMLALTVPLMALYLLSIGLVAALRKPVSNATL
jgi:sec-independent protein translocase protein TatC